VAVRDTAMMASQFEGDEMTADEFDVVVIGAGNGQRGLLRPDSGRRGISVAVSRPHRRGELLLTDECRRSALLRAGQGVVRGANGYKERDRGGRSAVSMFEAV